MSLESNQSRSVRKKLPKKIFRHRTNPAQPNTTLKDSALTSEMRTPIPGAEYYLMSLWASDEGTEIETGIETHSIRWADTAKRHEIRQASLVKPNHAIRQIESIGLPIVIVNNVSDLLVFTYMGGYAVIRRELAEQYFIDLISEDNVAPDGRGFRSIRSLPQQAFKHAPSPRLRLKVLMRDGRQCKICGRSPDNNVDVELHVHHIRPFGDGGFTVINNLITLCHTCHKGLYPHENQSLYRLIGSNCGQGSGSQIETYLERIGCY